MSDEENKQEENQDEEGTTEEEETVIEPQAVVDPAAADQADLNAEGEKREPEIIETTAVIKSPPKPKANQLKVVIIMKDQRALISVQDMDCDPISESMEGSLEEVLAWVPKTLDIARLKWAVSKKNPHADMPTPPPPPPRPATSTTSSRTSTATKTKPAAPPAQPNFF